LDYSSAPTLNNCIVEGKKQKFLLVYDGLLRAKVQIPLLHPFSILLASCPSSLLLTRLQSGAKSISFWFLHIIEDFLRALFNFSTKHQFTIILGLA